MRNFVHFLGWKFVATISDLRIRKSLEHLDTVRETSKEILDRFAEVQSRTLNTHFDFPLLQRLSLPVTYGNTRIA